MTLSDLISQVSALPTDAPITFRAPDGATGPGFHVTELKHADLQSVDCGGRLSQDAQASLQIFDAPVGNRMQASKLRDILERSLHSLPVLKEVPLAVEFTPGNTGVALHRIAQVTPSGEITLVPLQPLCKPLAEAQRQSATCCA